MANYPTALPAIPDVGDTLADPKHSVLHSGLRNELIAITTALGLQPSGTFDDVAARVADGHLGRSIFERAESITSTNAGIDVPFTSEVRDDDGWGDAGDSTFICPADGLYAVGVACVPTTAGDADIRMDPFRSVGLEFAAGTGGTAFLAAGDNVSVTFDTSGGAFVDGVASEWTLLIQRLA